MDTNVTVLNIEGDLTLPNAARWKDTLERALRKKDVILMVSLGQVADIDAAGIQVLYGAGRTAVERKRTMHFTGDLPEIVNHRLVASGFLKEAVIEAKDLESALRGFGGSNA